MIELENERRYLNQWALNQRVQIDNFLPGTWVEFSIVNDVRNSTLITEAYEETGHVYANIPNVLLQNFGYLHVYVNPPATDMAHTPEEKDFKVVRQRKPGHYIYTETPTVSYEAKVDIFWGKEHAGKTLVVGEDGYLDVTKKTIDDSVATDDEVGDAVDDVFGEGNEPPKEPEDPGEDNTGGENPDNGSTDDGGDDDNIATDKEVSDVVGGIFGNG